MQVIVDHQHDQQDHSLYTRRENEDEELDVPDDANRFDRLILNSLTGWYTYNKIGGGMRG